MIRNLAEINSELSALRMEVENLQKRVAKMEMWFNTDIRIEMKALSYEDAQAVKELRIGRSSRNK